MLTAEWSDFHWEQIDVHEGNTAIITRRFHSELYMWIHCTEMAEKCIHWVFFTILTTLSTYFSIMGKVGDILDLMQALQRNSYVDVCNNSIYQGTHYWALELLVEFPLQIKTELLIATSSSLLQLFLWMTYVFFKEQFRPFSSISSVNFLLIILIVPLTRILVNNALISKDNKFSSGATLCFCFFEKLY